MPVVAATQRPSVDIIPKSLRDLFGYRAAFRCTSDGSSDIILGDGWSGKGFTATAIPPANQGLCYLIAEGGIPRRVKVAYLTDDDITGLAAYAAALRRHRGITPTTGRKPIMTGTDHPASTADAAAQWLLAEYDATGNPFEDFDLHDGPGVHWHGMYVQPMFQLKTDMEPRRGNARHRRRLPRPRPVVAMTTRPKDYYAVLGVPPDATTRQIKAAYRKLAKVHHPDACIGDPDAAGRFRLITEAYETLADPQRRTAYDRTYTPPPDTGLTMPGRQPGRQQGPGRPGRGLDRDPPPPRPGPPGRPHHRQRHRHQAAQMGPLRRRPLVRQQHQAPRGHGQRRGPGPHPGRGPRHPAARGRPRAGRRTRHHRHQPPGPLPQQEIRRRSPANSAWTSPKPPASAGPSPPSPTPPPPRYAGQLGALKDAMTLWRNAEHTPAAATRRSTNLIAAACPCGRSIRVAASTLDEAPITCQACDGHFEPKN